MSESEYESSSSSSEEDLGSDYDPADFESSSEGDDSDDETRKVLFLTNAQAELIAKSSASLDKMLEAFEIQRPPMIFPGG